MSILPFANVRLSIVHRSVAALPPPSGSIATAQWQHYHRSAAALPPGGVRWNSLQEEMEKSSFKRDNDELQKRFTHKVCTHCS